MIGRTNRRNPPTQFYCGPGNVRLNWLFWFVSALQVMQVFRMSMGRVLRYNATGGGQLQSRTLLPAGIPK